MSAEKTPVPDFNLALLRHGASTANTDLRFGGWDDVPLAPLGIAQARHAGLLLKSHGIRFDVAYVSVLRRAITTLWHTLDALEQCWLPVCQDWRLNERHYGALQGLSKPEAVLRFGREPVQAWRRGWDARPPALAAGGAGDAWGDRRYADLAREQVPVTESLKDTCLRVKSCWKERLTPALGRGERVLVVAHGNSIRALLAHLLELDSPQVAQLEVANAEPLLLKHSPNGTVLVAL